MYNHSKRAFRQAYTVEGVNSDLRHYIPALRRKSKCFFRSVDTMKAVFKLFVHSFNQFALAKFNFPSLKSSFSLIHYIYTLILGTSHMLDLTIFLFASIHVNNSITLII